MDTQQFNGTFWITISGMIMTFLGTIMVYCLKSKCKNCNICYGLVKIERDIEAEVSEEKELLNKGINPYEGKGN